MIPQRAFDGKVVIMTGGASGIGLAAARQFAAHGALVAVNDLDSESIAPVVREIEAAGGNAFAIPADAADPDAVDAAVAQVLDQAGRIDILVNCAGIFYHGPAEQVPVAEWRRTISINLDGPFHWSRAVALASMLPRGAGAIVNVASLAGIVAGPGSSPYTAAKHGLVGLTKALAVEWGPAGIRVNAICPGLTETAMVTAAWAGRAAAYADRLARIPSGRAASADDQANAILFLASPMADAINGLIMPVDGGTAALSSGYGAPAAAATTADLPLETS